MPHGWHTSEVTLGIKAIPWYPYKAKSSGAKSIFFPWVLWSSELKKVVLFASSCAMPLTVNRTASYVAQDEKRRVRGLGSGLHSKYMPASM
ncbi:hypothetical protein CEXT_639561 [Caerostris extrusa]|uniref:Uncharacterized protein n=1 Tax=Caerostris extrusa TaxID=172846 RepID=A0AAV4U2U0_CAEEX|nr:hypothetical protein CEXT_639561 [Caerostris extrusa]